MLGCCFGNAWSMRNERVVGPAEGIIRPLLDPGDPLVTHLPGIVGAAKRYRADLRQKSDIDNGQCADRGTIPCGQFDHAGDLRLGCRCARDTDQDAPDRDPSSPPIGSDHMRTGFAPWCRGHSRRYWAARSGATRGDPHHPRPFTVLCGDARCRVSVFPSAPVLPPPSGVCHRRRGRAAGRRRPWRPGR